jgi:hypothetical protein
MNGRRDPHLDRRSLPIFQPERSGWLPIVRGVIGRSLVGRSLVD